jgi:hypothetical protein
MSTRAKRAFIALVGVTALVVAVVFVVMLWVNTPASGRLLDGTQVVLQKVSFGTNHTSPKVPLGLLRHFPAEWSAKIQWNPGFEKKATTARPIFAFWLKFSKPVGAAQPIGYAIADENGFEALTIFDGPNGAYSPGGFSKNQVGLVIGIGAFPHRSKKFFLRLYQRDGNGKRIRVAEFLVRNHQFHNLPGRKPQGLPIEQQTNGLAFSLVKAEVGVTPPGAILAPYDLQAGDWSEFRFRVSQQGQPSAGWTINEMWISDAGGNRLRVSAEDNGAFNGQFSRTEADGVVCLHRWEFWSQDPAWRLSVHFERPGSMGYWFEYLVHPTFLNSRERAARNGEQTASVPPASGS